MTGLSTLVVQFGTIAQAYGICLFFSVAAFCMTCDAAERRGLLYAAAAGFCASAAACCSLLSAPAAPVLWLWMLMFDNTQRRIAKAAAFVAGAVIPVLPIVRLYLSGPRQVLFNLFQYHLVFRRVHWEDATHNDIDVLTSWIDSPQALLIGALAIVGLIAVTRSRWPRAQKAPYWLCAALSVGLAFQEATAHPTFARYFVLVVPFASILAAGGLYVVATRMAAAPRYAVAAVALLMSLGLARALFDEVGDFHWPQFEKIAARVQEVTPPGAPVWADEHIYFLTHRPPPFGMEFAFGHKLTLPPEEAHLFHLVPLAEVQRQLLAKQYATAVSCEEEEGIDRLQLPTLYAMRTKFPECSVFYQLR